MTWAQFPLWMVGSPPAHNGGASRNTPSTCRRALQGRGSTVCFTPVSMPARADRKRKLVKVTLASTAVDVEREEQDPQEQAADEPCSGCVHIQEPRREDHGRTPFFVGLRIRVDREVNRKNEE